MRNTLKNITVWATLALFLFSTGGFSLYIHTCDETGSHSISLTGENDPCCKKVEAVEKKCCKKEIAELHVPKKKSCCDDKVFKKQLLVENIITDKKIDLKFTYTSVLNHQFVLKSDFTSFTKNLVVHSNAPPLSGRSKLILHSTFLI